jgi:DNA-binding MurR/RpiR family transcriptional regulator
MADGPRLLERIGSTRESLPPSERRVGEVVLADPQAVAFGTVASLAERAGTSGPTVIRFANRLGFAGYRELQQAVQAEMGQRLRPAVDRIRSDDDHGRADVVARALRVEVANVQASLEGIDPDQLDQAAALLTDPDRAVHVLPSEQARSVGAGLAAELGILRDGVHLLFGSEFRVASLLAGVGRGDVVLTIDLRRYERWVVEAQRAAIGQGARAVTITDGALSPLAAGPTFVAQAEATGPFDSLIGVHALANVLVAEVARRLRRPAARRLDRLERSWTETGALIP